MLGKYIVDLRAKGYDVLFEESRSEGAIKGSVTVSVVRMNAIRSRYISKYDLAAINIPMDDFLMQVIDKLVKEVDDIFVEPEPEKKSVTEANEEPVEDNVGANDGFNKHYGGVDVIPEEAAVEEEDNV